MERFRPHSAQLRARVLEELAAGENAGAVARRHDLPERTVSYWKRMAAAPRKAAPPRVRPSLESEAWQEWLQRHFAAAIGAGFSARHVEFWRWVWQVEVGRR